MTDDEARLFRRLVISEVDLQEAHSFFQHLEALSDGPARLLGDEESTRLALTVAGVIAYARPFKRSRGDNTAPMLTLDAVPELRTLDIRLHNELLIERDQIAAHSDADLWQYSETSVWSYDAVPHVIVPRRVFEGEFLTRVLNHVRAVETSIGRARVRMNPRGIRATSYRPPRAS